MEIRPPWKIRCRACIRIGELSRDLETAQGGRNELLPNDGKKSKSETLADAGIATSTAHDYEQLAGGKEKQAQDVADRRPANSSATGARLVAANAPWSNNSASAHLSANTQTKLV